MLNLLFVCHGNTCRSPMAEGLARHTLEDQVFVESAGICPGSEVSPEAVDVLRHRYGVDISGHRPRNVDTLPLDIYDRIIALDGEIWKTMSSTYPQIRERLVRWQVGDPYRQGSADYVRAAAEIESEIRALASSLGLAVSK